MTPERLDLWIHKVVPGGRSLTLVHEQALGQGLTVASWTREDVDDAKERALVPSIAAQLLEAAQDHADSVQEACRFVIQWVNDAGRPLRSLVHRVQPERRAELGEGAAFADAVSPNAIIGQLLSHVSGQQKVINGSIGVVLSAYERAMHMQQAMMKAQAELLQAHMLEGPTRSRRSESSEELDRMKIRAFEKLVELGPGVLQMAVGAVMGRVTGEPANDDDDDDEAPKQEQQANGRSVS